VGCSNLSTEHPSTIDLRKYRHIHVDHRLNDNHEIDLLIVRELQRLGHTTSVGPLTMVPENADAIITYEDEWTYDFTTHMISLEVTIRDAHTDKKIGTGRYYRPSITRKTPAEMVHAVITSLFKSH